MIHRKSNKYGAALSLAAFVTIAAGGEGCSAVNVAKDASQGCNEWPSSVSTLSIDANTKAFVVAVADLVTVSAAMESAVLGACIGIDTDLMVTDTWTAKGPAHGGSTDAEVTEACNQASAKITAILQAQQQLQATCTLAVTGGGCQVSADVEASCDTSCSGGASCTPPDVTVSCDPAELSGQCSGMCQGSATCEGSATVAAQCQGSCEAECQGDCTPPTAGKIRCEGTCTGNCYGTCTVNGTATPTGAAGMAACAGTCSGQCDAKCTYTPGKPARCDGSCSGTCTGNCKLDASAMVNCGANVSCKGGCTVMVTAPKCEGELKPPSCMADANCKGSCQAHAEATASCTPPTATMDCSTNASTDVQALVATVQKNLPALVNAATSQGPIAVKAIGTVATTGNAVVASAGSLGGKAIVCATTAASAAVSAQASIQVSVSASASVSGSCGGPTQG